MGCFTGRFRDWNLTFIILASFACIAARAAHIFPLSFLANLGRRRKIPWKMQVGGWVRGVAGVGCLCVCGGGCFGSFDSIVGKRRGRRVSLPVRPRPCRWVLMAPLRKMPLTGTTPTLRLHNIDGHLVLGPTGRHRLRPRPKHARCALRCCGGTKIAQSTNRTGLNQSINQSINQPDHPPTPLLLHHHHHHHHGKPFKKKQAPTAICTPPPPSASASSPPASVGGSPSLCWIAWG
jgi:hypothetical protein